MVSNMKKVNTQWEVLADILFVLKLIQDIPHFEIWILLE